MWLFFHQVNKETLMSTWEPIKNGQSRETDNTGCTRQRKTKQTKNTTQHLLNTTVRKINTNNVKKTWALQQATGGKDEPNIVFMRKLLRTIRNWEYIVGHHKQLEKKMNNTKPPPPPPKRFLSKIIISNRKICVRFRGRVQCYGTPTFNAHRHFAASSFNLWYTTDIKLSIPCDHSSKNNLKSIYIVLDSNVRIN